MSRRTDGTFRVGGSDKKLPTIGAALSFAQYLACQARDEKQYGVYEGERQVARVVRDSAGNVVTRMVV